MHFFCISYSVTCEYKSWKDDMIQKTGKNSNKRSIKLKCVSHFRDNFKILFILFCFFFYVSDNQVYNMNHFSKYYSSKL